MLQLRIGEKPLKKWLILLASSLILTACPKPNDPSQMPEQIKHVWEVDSDHMVLGRYRVISNKPFKIAYDDDVAIQECNGCIAITHEDFMAIVKAFEGQGVQQELDKRKSLTDYFYGTQEKE